MCRKVSYPTRPSVIKAVKHYSKRFGYARYYICPRCAYYHIASSSYVGEGYISGKKIDNPKSYYP